MIELSGVGKVYGDRRILNSVELTVPPGAVQVLRGTSGSGKSTLLNIIAGYTQPDEGLVTVTGTVGYLMQEELLFSKLSVLDNLELRLLGVYSEPDEPPATSEEGLQRATDWLRRLGLDHLAHAETATLSGGERRRVEIAAIMTGEPDLILLDEPTANLDPSTAASVYEALWSVSAGRTVVVATHEPAIPGLPDGARQVSVEGGRLRAQEGSAHGHR